MALFGTDEDKCRFKLVDRPRDLHGTKADWQCTVHGTASSNERECKQVRERRQKIKP